jgi:hypothetical protein
MTAVYAAAVLAYIALWFGTAVICWLKGKHLWATLGLFTGWHVIPAIRLAKPDSWWAERRYDADKLDRAKARFGHGVPDHVAGGDYDELAELSPEEVAGMDKITRRAWEKERKRRVAG